MQPKRLHICIYSKLKYYRDDQDMLLWVLGKIGRHNMLDFTSSNLDGVLTAHSMSV